MATYGSIKDKRKRGNTQTAPDVILKSKSHKFFFKTIYFIKKIFGIWILILKP